MITLINAEVLFEGTWRIEEATDDNIIIAEILAYCLMLMIIYEK